jgi:putative acetyltransferase
MNFFQNIREMQPTDLVGVVNFWNRIEGIGMSPDDNPDALSSYLAHNPGLSFVAFDGEELVGAVLCGQDERRGYINHLAVAKSHRKCGLGARLVNCCLEACQPRCIIFIRPVYN